MHLEACREPGVPLSGFDPLHVPEARVRETLAAVRATGARVGLALEPATPLAAAGPFLDAIDLLLVMTVEPGFGGQAFRDEQIPKVRKAAEWKRAHGARFLIEVDGGIGPETAHRARAAGAEVFVAGSSVFGGQDPVAGLDQLRSAIGATAPR